MHLSTNGKFQVTYGLPVKRTVMNNSIVIFAICLDDITRSFVFIDNHSFKDKFVVGLEV